ncbi:hypothetical protein [Microvirga soli]|uniref:hypothetical protein n=1 Tax=Microvirga soli TaxID=1854496 RepID=UPI00191F3AE5|nr:hypothetical protein [Microvirga soli]
MAVMPVAVVRAMTTVAAKGAVAPVTGIAVVVREAGTAGVTATETAAVVEVAGEVAHRAMEVVKAGETAEITATVRGVVEIAAAPAAVRAMEMAGVKAVGALEAAVVRVLGTVAVPTQAMEAAAQTPGEVAGAMGELELASAKGLGTAAVLAALEVAARAVAALELVVIRAPGPVAVPARAMQAEAVLVPEALGAL